MQAQFACASHDRGGRKVRRLEEDIPRGIGDARFKAAHDAGYRKRVALVRDQHEAGIEHGLAAVEQLQRLVGARMPHHDVALQRIVVEGMHRLTQLQHHVVGHVHHRADRAHAGATQPLGHPQRRASGRIDTLDNAPQVTRRIFAGPQADAPAGSAGNRSCRDGRQRGHTAEQGGHVVSQSMQAQAIRAVGRDAQLDTGIRQPEIIRQREAHRRLCRQLEQARGVGIDTQLAGRAQHAKRLHTTQPGWLDRHVARQHRAHHCQWHLDANTRIGRTADDLQQARLTGIHHAYLQAIRFGMPRGRNDLRNHDLAQRIAQRGDFLDLQAGHGQGARQRIAIGADLDQFAQPILGKFHRWYTCLRNVFDGIRRTA